ncbi:MAG: diguanylate cyclase [Thiogranum sp.]|nr:diguanylate cyclase [Thiogranum sp.]
MTEATATKPTILVVDDSRLMRVAARKILRDDFEILEAEDGEVAWDKLQEAQEVTLVMSDLSMPNLDGLGLLKKIRESSHAHLQDLPVIIVTGAEDDDGSKKTALAAGASDFITKPFESVQLLARAKAQARQQHTQQALQSTQASHQQLEQQSQIDQLTGLANRRAFISHIEEDLSYAIRHRTELTVLLVRVEKYKVMFLRRGKPAAEETLRRLAGVLTADRRREDTVARIGMDTFGILLPSANPPGANRVAQQLRTAIGQQDFSIDGDPVQVSVSIGVSSGDIRPDSKADALLEEAVQALENDANGAIGIPPQSTPAIPSPEPAQALATQPLPPAPAAAEPSVEPVASAAEASTPMAFDASEAVTAPAQDITTDAPLSAADVAQALEQLASGNHPAQDTDALVRAVIPVLECWNRAHNGAHSALLAQLNAVLDTTRSQAPAAEVPAESNPEPA